LRSDGGSEPLELRGADGDTTVDVEDNDLDSAQLDAAELAAGGPNLLLQRMERRLVRLTMEKPDVLSDPVCEDEGEWLDVTETVAQPVDETDDVGVAV
jgi:hypothetical protein